MAENIPYDIIVAPADEPLVLAGPPGQLTGSVGFHNLGNANVVLRDAGLSDPSGVLTTRPVRQALSTIVLRPFQAGRVPLTVAVAPTTPPGEYRAELELAGQSRPVVLHVAEVFALTIRPQSFVIRNLPGQPQRKRLIVTNEGNVAFAIDAIGSVDLEDDLLLDRPVRVALEAWREKTSTASAEPVLTLVRVGREGSYLPDGLLVRTLSGKVDVAPGETTAIDLEITLRIELPRDSRYRGRASVLTRDLDIIVVASGGPVASEAPPTSIR
jgi:hypothetical protein